MSRPATQHANEVLEQVEGFFFCAKCGKSQLGTKLAGEVEVLDYSRYGIRVRLPALLVTLSCWAVMTRQDSVTMKHCEHCNTALTTSAYRVNISVEFMGVLDQKRSLLCRSCADTAGAFERLDFPSFETVRDTTMHTVKSPCQNCGLMIMQKPSERIYTSCSDTCRDSIARRQRKIAPKSKPCGHCGELFSPKRKTARFCSDKCRVNSSRAN